MDKLLEIICKGLKWIIDGSGRKGSGTVLKRLLVFIVIIGIILIAWLRWGKENYWQEHYQKPFFTFGEENETDCIKSDIGLRQGNIIVTPILAVRYNGEIIRTVMVSNYYNNNEAVLINNNEGESYFRLEVGELQRQKIADVSKVIKELLNERKQEKFDVETVYLANIMYQNKKSGKSREDIYWYFSVKRRKKISKTEKELWEPEYVLDLEEYEREGFKYNNSQLMLIVNGCLEVVNM